MTSHLPSLPILTPLTPLTLTQGCFFLFLKNVLGNQKKYGGAVSNGVRPPTTRVYKA